MSTIKSAISLPSNLFDEADEISKKIKMPRSRLFALAISEFIDRYKAKKIRTKLNTVYKNRKANPVDTEISRRVLAKLAKLPGNEW